MGYRLKIGKEGGVQWLYGDEPAIWLVLNASKEVSSGYEGI